MLQKLRERSQSESGFTLVELLVVMLILGLLAAIAIPAFFNQREKAKDSDAKSAVRTAQTAIETYATDNDGSYAGTAATIVATMKDIEPTLNDSPGSTLAVSGNTDSEYTVTVKSDSGNYFWITRQTSGATLYGCGTTAGTVATTAEAGCPADGDWSG